MLFSALCFSTIPVLATITGAQDNPIHFMVIYNAGFAIGSGIYVYLKHIEGFTTWENSKKIMGVFFFGKKETNSLGLPKQGNPFSIFGRNSFLIRIQGVRFVFFAWSLVYIHSLVATVLFELWPLVNALVLAKVSKEHEFPSRAIVLSILAFAGAVLVVLSDFSNGNGGSEFGFTYLFGLVLAASTLVFTAHGATRIELSNRFCDQFTEAGSAEKVWFKMFFVSLSSVVSLAIGVALFGISGLLGITSFSFQLSAGDALLIFLGGLVFSSMGQLFASTVFANTRNLKIAALSFSAPLFTFLLYLSFSPLEKLFPELDKQLSSINLWLLLLGFLVVSFAGIAVVFSKQEAQ